MEIDIETLEQMTLERLAGETNLYDVTVEIGGGAVVLSITWEDLPQRDSVWHMQLEFYLGKFHCMHKQTRFDLSPDPCEWDTTLAPHQSMPTVEHLTTNCNTIDFTRPLQDPYVRHLTQVRFCELHLEKHKRDKWNSTKHNSTKS